MSLLIPLTLAIGNVYRTLDWPKDADPIWLAVGSHAVAGVILTIIGLAVFAPGEIARAATVPGAVLMQAAASSLMLPLFFRLQHVGGPVTLSQIGVVAAAVGVCVGAFLLGERYAAVVWTGVAVIGIGVSLTVIARLREPKV